MDRIRLPSDKYDVVVLGTSLVECILASALARAGKSVLHMDHKDYYGGNIATLNVTNLMELARMPSERPGEVEAGAEEQGGPKPIAAGEMETLVEAAGLSKAGLEFVSIDTRIGSPFEGCGFFQEEYQPSPSPEKTGKIHPGGSAEAAAEGKEGKGDKEGKLEKGEGTAKEAETEQETGGEGMGALTGEAVEENKKEEEKSGTENKRPGGPTTACEQQNVPENADGTPTEADVDKEAEGDADGAGDSAAKPHEQKKDPPQADTQAEAKKSIRPDPEIVKLLQKKPFRFCLDLDPRLILSRGALVELLIRMDVGRYLEFRAVASLFTVVKPTTTSAPPSACSLWRVPVSRSIVFKDPTLSLGEKRVLMRLMQAVQGTDQKSSENTRRKGQEKLNSFMEKPFREYLESIKAPEKLQTMMLYSLAQAEEDQHNGQTKGTLLTSVAVKRLRLLLMSLGRYGPGAYLYPQYGTGEVPQAFTRLCAVHGGIYLLRYIPRALVFENEDTEERKDGDGTDGTAPGSIQRSSARKRFRGIITPGRQFIRSDYLIGSRNLISPQLSGPHESKTYSRCIIITDAPLKGSGSENAQSGHSCMAVVPPMTLGNSKPVRMMQFDHVACACPKGCYVIYLSCHGTGDAKVDLEPLVAQLTRNSKTLGDVDPHERPVLLSSAYYTHKIRNPTAANKNHHENVIIAEDLEYGVDFDGAVDKAKELFTRICPGEPFLPGRKEDKKDEDKEGLDNLLDFDINDLASEFQKVSTADKKDESGKATTDKKDESSKATTGKEDESGKATNDKSSSQNPIEVQEQDHPKKTVTDDSKS